MPSSTKRGLGRGLEALLPGSDAIRQSAAQLPVGAIGRNPRQPRAKINPDDLEELVLSIREHGVIQPLIVAVSQVTGRYTLIAGERRLEAAKLAGLVTVPAVVRGATEQQLLEVALVENIQRSDLGPLEAARAYQHLAEDFGLSHDEIAARVGKKRVTVTNTLRLLKLPARLLEALAAGEISEGHARALLALSTAESQVAALATMRRRGFTVRQTEEYVRRLQGERPTRRARPAPAASAEAEDVARRLRERLGTKVTLRRGPRGGRIIVHFYSDEELTAIAHAILGE